LHFSKEKPPGLGVQAGGYFTLTESYPVPASRQWQFRMVERGMLIWRCCETTAEIGYDLVSRIAPI
jgi:hypothetical protein